MNLLQENAEITWDKCLRNIKEKISEQSYKTWFKPIKAKRLEDKNLTIQVPDQFFYEWLEEHYIIVLKEALYTTIGAEGRLTYSIIKPETSSNKKKTTIKVKNSTIQHKFLQKAIHTTTFNDKHTLENFIEGDNNRLAKSAAMAVANKPGGTSFNPLMIYSEVGLGKTHLLHAIGYKIQQTSPNLKCIYLSSECFTNQFVEAIKNNEIQDFIEYYVKADVLLIDDIQFLAGKVKTQEHFFHIFNHIHQNDKQIAITSDCPPSQLEGLQERLLSRFRWGLTTDIQKPSFETKMAIIESRLEQNGISVPVKHIQYIASAINSNIRDLEGAIVSILAHISISDNPISLDLIKQILNNLLQKAELDINIKYLHGLVAQHMNIPKEHLQGKSRKREIVIARQMAMYLAKNYTDLSLKAIGKYFGNKHHSTVIHAIQSVEDMVSTQTNIKHTLNALINVIKVKLPS